MRVEGPLIAFYTSIHHDKHQVNDHGPVAANEVRQSRKYSVSVRLAEKGKFQDSFVYESIPRNGDGKMYYLANPGQEYKLQDGDGITIETDAKINMAWTQFQYSRDVEVRIKSNDNSEFGPASNVVIHTPNVKYTITSPDLTTVVILNDLCAYRSNGQSYVESEGVLVSEELWNASLIFASPFIPKKLIPSKTSLDTQVLKLGKITESTIRSNPTLYFEAGIYWMEKDGHLGKIHIKLDPNTNYVYFESGTYIKGAFEYITSKNGFYTIGHGVVSGEDDAYMANTAKNYVAEKGDRTRLRIFPHQSVLDTQTWHWVGPTLNAPPFNTVDLFSKCRAFLEDKKVKQQVSDYKQVGAFYFQTDGPQIYTGTVKGCFWHKCHNDPVVQMGWKPPDVSGVSAQGLRVIHTHWFMGETVLPSAIIGTLPDYQSEKFLTRRTLTVEISDITCEGHCPVLFRISPLQGYDLSVRDVNFNALLKDYNAQLG
ncbi:glycosyl hydrolase family 49-domain-containing protein [Dactylonectria macrodidyma]|uniref:Glycosyl hydrolase family 49-domain-containing protein n=1 Tax=Dactylonectria macrodidyma TaxID=307937 RepID=A0A9P9FER8_9HYPO|nr:glycosyl hydrolase family 49-domain-containing protein [Dactylonectria macrodidyma]